MCNCNKGRKSAAQPRRAGTANSQSFALLVPGKPKESFGSRLEADAANARVGYRGIVKPVAA